MASDTPKKINGRPRYKTRADRGIRIPLTLEELQTLTQEAAAEGRNRPQHLRIKLGLKPL